MVFQEQVGVDSDKFGVRGKRRDRYGGQDEAQDRNEYNNQQPVEVYENVVGDHPRAPKSLHGSRLQNEIRQHEMGQHFSASGVK